MEYKEATQSVTLSFLVCKCYLEHNCWESSKNQNHSETILKAHML